ncbi:MAG TPA: metallophosphoesterase [Candidatus Peribacteraceae bacterium]|nr:metallophosphoesterase [Candidatus Peribacteraceae bacterium]
MTYIPLTHRPVFWDALIALLCIALVAWIALSSTLFPAPASGIGVALGVIGLAIVSYGSFIEPKRISLNTKSIQKSLPAMRIAVIGDLHVGPYKQSSFVEKIARNVNALDPDLIFIVGDFLFDHTSDIFHLDPLRELTSRYGTFGIIGNHDSGRHLRRGKHFVTRDRSDEVSAYLQERGVAMLRNKSHRLDINGTALRVAGIDDIWMSSSDLDAALNGIANDEPTILLSHNPDVILDERSHHASLIISGHTHGGQIRLPFVGSLYPLPDRLGRAYDQGIFHISDRTTLAITHGIGETQTRARLFCPPEILVLHIHP